MADIEVTEPKARSGRDPFAELENWAQNMRHSFPAWPYKLLSGLDGVDFTPLADVVEEDGAWQVEVELPGIEKGDIDVEVKGRTLVITGTREEKEREGVFRQRNRVTGTFRYEVILSADFDAESLEASLDNGVLTITIPKAEPSETRKIEVR
mgnify:CR=1 FL=1